MKLDLKPQKILFFNLLLVLNIALYWQSVAIFVSCGMFLLCLLIPDAIDLLKAKKENSDVIALRKEVELIKTQIAFQRNAVRKS